MKKIFFLVFLLFVIAGGLYLVFQKPEIIHDDKGAQVTNFDECAEAGYPVLESYPALCKTPAGKSFTQDIGNRMEMKDIVRADVPLPGTVISSPLTIKGEARGQWYFEASFPIELRDGNGGLIAAGAAQAESDWMTEDFVPYSATLEFSAPQTATGTLILKKDNPSELPENDNQLVIPVKF